MTTYSRSILDGANLSKHMAVAEKHNRCVVDAGRFHYLVIDIPLDTICPRCDLIFHDTAELQRHLASMEYPPPEGHSSVINAETSDSACVSDLWQKIRDRWRARRAERETKTHQTAAWRDEGRRDDGGHELGQKGSAKGANKSTDANLHNAVLQTLCVLSQQVREVRSAVFMCWMIKKEAPEYKKPKEQLRAFSELAATKGKGHGLGPAGIAAFTGLWQPLSERGKAAQWKRPTQLVWQILNKRGTNWNRREHSTSLQAGQSVRPSSEPSRPRHQRGTTPRTHSWGTQTNRSESSSRSSSKRRFGTGTVSRDRTELKKVNFVAASRPDSPIRPRVRQVDWRQGIASDKELMDRATGKMVGTGGSAVSSMLGQLLTSAEIEIEEI